MSNHLQEQVNFERFQKHLQIFVLVLIRRQSQIHYHHLILDHHKMDCCLMSYQQHKTLQRYANHLVDLYNNLNSG